MTEAPLPDSPDEGGLAPGRASAGAQLKAARESYGLSIDVVAQHLKLAPRQVRALEEDAYGELPGRTFVRGFSRNYAKLLHLDADAIVAALPPSMTSEAAAHSPSTIAPSQRPMGELPVSGERRRVGWSRVAIVAAIAALIAVAAVYEFTGKRDAAPESGAAIKSAPADPIGPPAGSTPLPNPITGGEAPADSGDTPSVAPVADGGIGAGTAPSAEAQPAAVAPAAAGTLVIDYRAAAWTEVRDAGGERLLVGTMPARSSQTVTGVPPLELTLGNAINVSVTWRGAPVDLTPHIKANIARVRLQ